MAPLFLVLNLHLVSGRNRRVLDAGVGVRPECSGTATGDLKRRINDAPRRDGAKERSSNSAMPGRTSALKGEQRNVHKRR